MVTNRVVICVVHENDGLCGLQTECAQFGSDSKVRINHCNSKDSPMGVTHLVLNVKQD